MLTSCVLSSNFTYLSRLGFPLQSDSYFSKQTVITLHSSEVCPGPCSRHVFVAPVYPSLRWLAFFCLKIASASLLEVGRRGRLSSLTFPHMISTVGIYPIGFFRRCSPFVDFFRYFHLLENITSFPVCLYLKVPSLWIVFLLSCYGDCMQKNLVEIFRRHILGGV